MNSRHEKSGRKRRRLPSIVKSASRAGLVMINTKKGMGKGEKRDFKV
jgi:hypothetical protein